MADDLDGLALELLAGERPAQDVERQQGFVVEPRGIEREVHLQIDGGNGCLAALDTNLFTEDGVFETDAFGTHEGRDAIRALRHLPFAVHYVMNPIIDIDGDTATGKWLLLEPCSFPQGDERQPIWVAAKYEDDYPRVDGEWKFKRVKLMSLMWSPYEQGLEKQRIIGQ